MHGNTLIDYAILAGMLWSMDQMAVRIARNGLAAYIAP
ncbi:hypothetical protein Z949_3716 [Sulfitobacter guttiformis KCTC 32187]|nr:hypothetical protein Z949_3716 [Sulfitobacter guttiformis KCTC 32187]